MFPELRPPLSSDLSSCLLTVVIYQLIVGGAAPCWQRRDIKNPASICPQVHSAEQGLTQPEPTRGARRKGNDNQPPRAGAEPLRAGWSFS